MVTLSTNFGYLKNLIKKDLTLNELEALLFELGFEIESIKGEEILIEITPDRPDLLCAHGLARTINNFLGIVQRNYRARKSNIKIIVDDSVKDIRPYTVCAVVKNLNFNEEKLKEIIDFQEKLHNTFARGRKKAAIGIYPLEKIKPPIYYKAEKPEKISFIPLDFSEEMNGIQILKRHPKGIEYGKLLKGKEKYPIFIDSKNEILSMPPIINSAKLGKVTEQTKEIFIECSGFDLEILKKTLNLIVITLADMGGEIYKVEVIYKNKKIETPDLNKEEIKLNYNNIQKLLGIKLNKKDIYKLLKKMGYLIEDNKIFLPCYRTDILHEVDVIDDIARAYGANNFDPEFPKVATIGGLSKTTRIKNKIRELMIGLGFQETFTLILTNKAEQFDKMNFKLDDVIYLENQIDKSINMLRVSLIPELLKVLYYNQHHELPQKIFEVGEVIFKSDREETKSIEKVYLTALITNSTVGYEDISSILDSFFSNLNLNYKLIKTKDRRFLDDRVAKIIVNNEEVGIVGEISPQVLENFKLERPVVCFELDIEFLF